MPSFFENPKIISLLEILSGLVCIPGVLIILGHLIRDVPSAAIFFWHPLMEATAFMIFLPQGALLLRGNRSLVRAVMEAFVSRERKVHVHAYFAGVGSLIFILGGVFMYFHKEELTRENPRLAHKLDGSEAEHFLTWHAWLGIFTVAFGAFVNSPLGLLLALNSIVRNCLSQERQEKIKGIHRITSYITYVLGCICMSLALFSDFISASHPFFRFVLGVIIFILWATMTITTFKPQPVRADRPF